MITLRPSSERGHADHGWLNTYHTFSFADYYDPNHMGYGPLRVINEDRVAPGAGFPTHAHHDMEIITIVLEGALEHKDSMGTNSVIRPGEIQRMTAGTGVRHSEYNASKSEPVHFMQIWIEPNKRGIAPGYDQKNLPGQSPMEGLTLLASNDGRDGSVIINQDVNLFYGHLGAGRKVEHTLRSVLGGWIQVLRGEVAISNLSIRQGDGAAIANEGNLKLAAASDSAFLLFDLGDV